MASFDSTRYALPCVEGVEGDRCCTYVVSVIERKDWVTCLHVVFLLCLSAKQVYSNDSELVTLHPNQTRFTLTQLTPGTPYLISVGRSLMQGRGKGNNE